MRNAPIGAALRVSVFFLRGNLRKQKTANELPVESRLKKAVIHL